MNHPGCFGVPSIFSFSSKVCEKCQCFDDCQRKSHSMLLSVKGVGFEAVLLRHERYAQENNLKTPEGAVVNITLPQSKLNAKPVKVKLPISDKQRAALEKMPTKVATLVRRVWKQGKDLGLIEAAKRGENPFPIDGFRPLHVAFKHLLTGGITKPYLTSCFVEELGWKKAAAQNETTLVWQALQVLGVAEEDGVALKSHPSIRGDNNRINYYRK